MTCKCFCDFKFAVIREIGMKMNASVVVFNGVSHVDKIVARSGARWQNRWQKCNGCVGFL